MCYHVPSLPPSLLNCALFRVLTQRLSNSLAVFSFKAGWADPPLPTPCYCVSPPYYTLPTCALECSSKSLSYSLVSPAACSFNAAKSFFVFSSSVFKGGIAKYSFKNLYGDHTSVDDQKCCFLTHCSQVYYLTCKTDHISFSLSLSISRSHSYTCIAILCIQTWKLRHWKEKCYNSKPLNASNRSLIYYYVYVMGKTLFSR